MADHLREEASANRLKILDAALLKLSRADLCSFPLAVVR